MSCLIRSLLVTGATLAFLSGCVSQTASSDTPVPTAAPVLPTDAPTATATIPAPTASPITDNLPVERLIFAEVTYYDEVLGFPSSSTLSIIQSDGSGYVPVLENDDLDGQHRFVVVSPDGSAALVNDVYLGGRVEPSGLVEIDLPSRTGRPIAPPGVEPSTYGEGSYGPPAWLPDSQHIVASYSAFGGTQYPGLVKLNLQDGSLERLTMPEGANWDDRWVSVSPNGAHIAFVRHLYDPAKAKYVFPGQVMIAGAMGEAIQEIATAIAEGSFPPGHHLFRFESPVWSPDSTKLAIFVLQKTTQAPGLGIYDITNGTQVVTSLQPGHYADLSWSPDGAQLVFSGDFEGNDELYLLSPDNPAPVSIASSPASDISPIWSPGGNYIAFLSDREEAGFYKLYLLFVETMQPRKLLDARVMWRPAWLPPAP